MARIERKLTTIAIADVVGFSKLMRTNEAGTLAALRACREIADGLIAEHHGRIFGTAGDALLVEFSSPVDAVSCASEFQKLIAERNAHPGTEVAMQFRVGINLGDVMIEGDNLYGDGVNIAARLEAAADPGGICVSSKVYEEVKRKLDIVFTDGGLQQLKNIDDPIGIYHLRWGNAAGDRGAEADHGVEPKVTARRSGNPTVTVHPLKIIGGGDEVSDLGEGLVEDILGGLTKVTAITVLVPHAPEASPNQATADRAMAAFALEGSIRASGQRLRLSFSLVDLEEHQQVWSERYDRTVEDLFALQDEIARSVVSTVRVRVKARVFEWLRATDDATLTVPELLDKAAGYFVRSYGSNDQAEAALRLAVEQAPTNSMAKAMLAMCLHRRWEFSARDMPADVRQELVALTDEAVALDPSSYFARLLMAVARQDILDDFDGALAQAETAVSLNPNFTQGQAMVAIARIHLGEARDGTAVLKDVIGSNKDDPHRYRHYRELALGHFVLGDDAQAARIAARLVEEAPDLARNRIVLAALQAIAGQTESARRQIDSLRSAFPELEVGNARLPRFGEAAAAERFREGLMAAGLPA
jgi:adenylate cyclase